MARKSLHERFDVCSTTFLMAVLGNLMQQRYRTAATAIGSSVIQRILIEDASGQVMPKSNAEAFPALGNYYGKTAGVTIDFAFDLLTPSYPIVCKPPPSRTHPSVRSSSSRSGVAI